MRAPQEPERLDLDWLTSWIAVGGAFPIERAERLASAHGITRVVDLRAEACDEELVLKRAGIALLHLPTADCCAIAQPMIREGVAWVACALAEGRRVLIHCQHGIGRSALLALCVLVEGGLDPLEALELAKGARRVVSPSPEQLEAFIEFARGVRARSPAARWAVPSFEGLARIAYRPAEPGAAIGLGRPAR
jgi:protein-tyrosine phosphatase